MAISEVTNSEPSIAVGRSPGTSARWVNRLKGLFKPVAANVKASPPVRLLQVDGHESVWIGARRMGAARAGARAKFVAVEVPEDLLLRRRASFPKISDADLSNAVRLDVEGHSPFAADDLSWGYTLLSEGGSQRDVEVALASRKQVANFLDASRARVSPGGRVPEVWALSSNGNAPIVLGGYGETRRQQFNSVRQRWSWILLAVACGLLALLLSTPTAKLRFQAVEAVNEMQTLTGSTAALMRKRDELTRLDDKLRALEAAAAGRVDPVAVIEYLTQRLPDDSYLVSIDIQKSKITATGHTNDSAALLQTLSSDVRLRDVRSPTAVTRMPGATKEAFTVEFVMNAPTAAPVGTPPLASAPAGQQSVTAAQSPASAPAKAASKAAPAAAASPFVVGGSR
jgi:general secretion pathway protein L